MTLPHGALTVEADAAVDASPRRRARLEARARGDDVLRGELRRYQNSPSVCPERTKETTRVVGGLLRLLLDALRGML
jgi:hypothetical protein